MTPSKNRGAYAGTQSVTRSLRLLKLFHSAPRLSTAQIRERAGLNRSTVFRILTALEAEGMLERDPGSDEFRLGPQIAALGRRAEGVGDLRELAQRPMQALALELNETVTLETLAGGEVTVVAEVLGDHVVGAQPSLGTSWPAHATSTGKVLLAALPPSARRRALRGKRLPHTERTLTDAAALGAELDRAARRGWAASVEELEPGYVAVAVPLRDANGAVLAALSVGGPKHRLPRRDLEEVAERLEGTAATITCELGGARA